MRPTRTGMRKSSGMVVLALDWLDTAVRVGIRWLVYAHALTKRRDPDGTVSFSLILVVGAQTTRGPAMVLSRQPQRPPRHGLHPSLHRLRTPTGPACGTVVLSAMRGLRLTVQRHLSPPLGRAGLPARPALVVQSLPGQGRSTAARRDFLPVPAVLPGVGGRPVRAQCRLPESVPDPGPAGLRGGRRHPVAARAGGGSGPDARPVGRSVGIAGVDETRLSIGGVKCPVAVVLGSKGERLDLRLSGPSFDRGGWFQHLAARGAQGLMTDDDPVYELALGGGRVWTASRTSCTCSAPSGGTSGVSTGMPRSPGPDPAADPATSGMGTTGGGRPGAPGTVVVGGTGVGTPGLGGAQAAHSVLKL